MSADNTIELISRALDAALMREIAIASNISHVNASGYQSMSVSFEEQLKNSLLTSDNGADNTPKPIYQFSNTPVSIDDELAKSVKNATHFRALIKGLNHKFAIMKLAVQGNNQA